MTSASKNANTKSTKLARAREVRDLYNKLRIKYKHPIVDKFFRDNYFLQPRTVESIIKDSDNGQVDLAFASVIYKVCMRDDFFL